MATCPVPVGKGGGRYSCQDESAAVTQTILLRGVYTVIQMPGR